MSRKRLASTLQGVGLGSLVVGAGLWTIAAAFVVAGIGLVLWGMAVEMSGE